MVLIHLCRLSLDFHTAHSSSELLRVLDEARSLPADVVKWVFFLIREVLNVLLLCAALGRMFGWRYATVIVACMFVYAWINRHTSMRVQPIHRTIRECTKKASRSAGRLGLGCIHRSASHCVVVQQWIRLFTTRSSSVSAQSSMRCSA
jgi:ABC-type transport system involved in Fe-S cluster assembly fused permease/ATPase subunit